MLETVENEPATPARSAVIWMHGLGADGHDFEPIVPELELPPALAARFVFPHAPVQPIAINGGLPMRAWFDILGLGGDRPEDAAGVAASAQRIEALIAREQARGIPAERIVLAGFSQGGAMALHVGLRHAQKLAGIMALSCWLPLRAELAALNGANPRTPILMCHGSYDPMVPSVLGEHSRDLLQQAGYTVEWRAYPMQHQVCLEEIADISRWLQTVLNTG